MPTDPAALTVAYLEIGLLLAGAWLFFRLVLLRRERIRWLKTAALPPWPLPFSEFLLLAGLVFAGSFLGNVGAASALGRAINRLPDHEGIDVIVLNSMSYAGALAGWWIFPRLRRGLYFDYRAMPPPAAIIAPPRLSWTRKMLYGGGTLLVALPVLSVVALGWSALLRRCGLPDEPQPLLAIFSGTQSPLVIAGLLAVACVLGPMYEERLFRAGLYHYCRQHMGRGWSLALSGVAFGAAHFNLDSFLPLAVFGAILALAYEATGSLAVTVIAHGLFNLNTLVVLLSGLRDLTP